MQSIGERPTLAFSTAVNATTPRNTAQMILSGNAWHGEDSMNYMPVVVSGGPLARSGKGLPLMV
jgi:hypothetical protein